MRFRKVHGAANDFVLVAEPDPGQQWTGLAQALCARRTGIGADGLVTSTLVSTEPAVLEVACYNADGSVATMCGNALRCAARCAQEDFGLQEMTLVMAGVKHEAIVRDGEVRVTAEVGVVEMRRLQAVHCGRLLWFDSAYTGTDHVVAVVEDVDAIDAEAFGRLVRHHTDLAPVGANVSFIQSVGRQELKIRTYERGVEAETASCGSGAVAAVVIATTRGLVAPRQVTVHNRAGTPLTVHPHAERPGKAYWISGPVTTAYEGVWA
ncbi:diaminopimelate epimerase [Streptomyces luteireticuli]